VVDESGWLIQRLPDRAVGRAQNILEVFSI
jgi:hypothetical protein